MTIDEAITLNISLKESDGLKYHPDLRDAVQLGIEALKRIKDIQSGVISKWWDARELLPGETDE